MSKTQQNTASFSKYKHFDRTDRDELSILLKKGYSLRNIADVLGRNPSSVSREVKRNSNVYGVYNPRQAQQKSYVKRKYSKYQGMKIRANPFLESYIHEKMKLGWSPERITGRLKWKTGYQISYKAVYKYIHRNTFGYDLQKYLKYQGKKRRKESRWGEIIKNRVFIGERPKIINSRLRYGDFEADTMGRTRDASSETLVVARERKSRYVLAQKVSRLKYAIDGFKKLLNPIPVRSVTFDNGVENARHEELNTKTYFCDPYSSWQKGSVENVIGVIREYIPKKSDLVDYSNDYISAIMNRINNTPMKCLQFLTPKEVFEGRYFKINKEQCCT